MRTTFRYITIRTTTIQHRGNYVSNVSVTCIYTNEQTAISTIAVYFVQIIVYHTYLYLSTSRYGATFVFIYERINPDQSILDQQVKIFTRTAVDMRQFYYEPFFFLCLLIIYKKICIRRVQTVYLLVLYTQCLNQMRLGETEYHRIFVQFTQYLSI